MANLVALGVFGIVIPEDAVTGHRCPVPSQPVVAVGVMTVWTVSHIPRCVLGICVQELGWEVVHEMVFSTFWKIRFLVD